MWRPEGNLVSYMYYPLKEERCGIDWRWDVVAKPGMWHEVTMYVRVNEPGMLQSCACCICMC
jgi:hypothetical protein